MSEDLAFYYFIQVVNAIAFLHENNFVHRDIKPENLLLDANHNLKLCDFGWCVSLGNGERATFCGTYEYMAPEIIQEVPYNKSIDVWSLGILLYELMHGYSPFRAINDSKTDGHQEIFMNVIKHEYSINDTISEKCKDLIESKIVK